ncbi:MAG: hypothetical protein WAK84_08145 [Candidatus Cybelea sp.]
MHREPFESTLPAPAQGGEKLAVTLTDQQNEIKQQREQNGTATRFSRVTSRRFPGGL